MAGHIIDLTNLRFGKLLVLRRNGRHPKRGGILWLCKCDCGNEATVHSSELRAGATRSCGCIMREMGMSQSMTREYRGQNDTHGKSKTPEHQAWLNAKGRCYNTNNRSYSDYGGRGIRMSDEWRNSFEAFLSDVGLRPSPEYSLDRIEVNGNYEPGNCKWSTDKEQINNRRIRRIENFSDDVIAKEFHSRFMTRTNQLCH